ncbi:HtaA domain-containing protein [Corynebacterium timonense]|uniref:Htaa protein n=1 Tax=Corynebacterium timonense TaxID=441500 RepID=A0A1H1QVI9_9CORY|nr:HtaA domain-containing protein [Corynebacterium timonense]SDS27464.1 Htaa protein [Corynebacterium timonense]
MNTRSLCRSLCAATATAGLLALGPFPFPALMPDAAAQDTASTHRTVTSGSVEWGVRTSFRNYIEGNIARGQIEMLSPASRTGGGFEFPVASSALSSSSSGQINFAGGVRFTGHSGVLDMTLQNPILVVNGTKAELRVDYRTLEYNGMQTHEPGKLLTGTEAVFATITLSSPADFSADTVTLNGTAQLASQATEVFGGFYQPGEELDPISISLSLGTAHGPAPKPKYSLGGGGGPGGNTGGGTGATRSNATTGPAKLLGTINDTLIEVNGLFVNSDNIMRNSKKLLAGGDSAHSGGGAANPNNTAAPANNGPTQGGQPAPAAPKPPNSAPGQAATSARTASAPHAAGGGAAGGAAPSTGASGDVCHAPGSRGVTSANAEWGVRQSFRTYIRGTIARGGWELSNVGDADKKFQFSGNSGAVDPGARSGSILFPGSIRFTGHSGILDTRFSNIEITFNGTTGSLIANVSSNDVEGRPHEYGRVALADLSFTQLDVSDSAVSGSATTALTAVGAEAFGQFYPVGDPLDPISFTATLGGSANCLEGQGGTASGAATGKGNSAENAQAKLSGAAATQAAGAGGSVLDDLTGDATTTSSEQPEGGKFQIKNAATGSGGAGVDDGFLARLLLLLGSVAGAGGALVRFVVK